MPSVITPENWKDLREREANERFPLESLVQYSWGFTRIDEGNFGKVLRITKSGNVYVVTAELRRAGRKPEKRPGDWQLGGWVDYDPGEVSLIDVENPLKFIAHLYQATSLESKAPAPYQLEWRGPKGSGIFNLHVPVIGANGFIRAEYEAFD